MHVSDKVYSGGNCLGKFEVLALGVPDYGQLGSSPESVANWLCSACGYHGPRARFRWISDSPFCMRCIGDYVSNGYIVKDERRPNVYTLTILGEAVFPGLVQVAYCPLDAMPIYRRWVDAGIAL